ncbi:hypothetical protein DZF95_01120 [Clavibacter michiganensis]|nr:hypothetical protein DZF95_01120 [Clavibacter michiganensis]
MVDGVEFTHSQQRLLEVFVARLSSTSPSVTPDTEQDAEAVVSRMFSTFPSAWDDKLGPFHSTTSLRDWMGVSRQAIDQQVRKGALLCLVLGDGTRAYPDFQFGADGSPLPHLREVLNAMDPQRIDLWGDALWLNTPAVALTWNSGGAPVTPAAALRTPLASEVIATARRIGAALAS